MYGARMTTAPEPAPSFQFQQPPPPPRKSNTTKIVLIVLGSFLVLIALLIGGCFLLVNSSTKDAQKVSDQLVTAVQQGDGDKVWALSGPSFRKVATQAQVNELVKRLAQLVTTDKVSPDGKSINASTDTGKVAVFTYKLKGKGRGPVYLKTQIRDEDGWKVLSFKSSETKLDTDVE
jgi:hypothetical protein